MFEAAEKAQKVSHYVVETIRDAILAGKFKPGDRLASEKELIDQFQVSKASIREALRVLEGMGLIEIRKGIGGGVFVAEVDMSTTINSLTNFLHFRNVSIGDITMLRYFVEPYLTGIAASKVSEKDILILEKATGEEVGNPLSTDSRGIGFHRHIARFSENPLLVLILDFIDSLLADLKAKLEPGPDFYKEVEEDHYKIIECLKKKDGAGARREMANHVLRVDFYLARLAGQLPFTPDDGVMEAGPQPEPPLSTNPRQPYPGEQFGQALRKVHEELGSILEHVDAVAHDLVEFERHDAERSVVRIGEKR